MRKIAFYVMAAFLSLTFIPLQANTSPVDPIKASPKTLPAPAPVSPTNAAKVITLESRLDEIDAIDKSELNAAAKKDLRKEVKSIKLELKSLGGGVYLSAGALVLIIILLIVLL
ncbi:MAG: hypothetical protein WD052_13630 [Bacteroidales bacterium]